MPSKRVFYSIIVLLFLSVNSFSQNKKDDLQIVFGEKEPIDILKTELYQPYHHHAYSNNARWMTTKSNSWLYKYNPLTLMFAGAMYTYQNAISVQLSSGCNYGLTCSNYSKEAIREFGLIKGVFISADRLMRCNGISILDLPLLYRDEKGKYIDHPGKYRLH